MMERDHLEDPRVVRIMILKWISGSVMGHGLDWSGSA